MRYRVGYPEDDVDIVIEAPAKDYDAILEELIRADYLCPIEMDEMEYYLCQSDVDIPPGQELIQYATDYLHLYYLASLGVFIDDSDLWIWPVPPNSALGEVEAREPTSKGRFRRASP